MAKREHELAGFVDEDGNLGRQVPTGAIILPEHIRLEGDVLHWGMGRYPGIRSVSNGMLDQFIRITDADSVLRFAENWGVLGFDGGKVLFPAREYYSGGGTEPVSAWQYYARRASAVLNVAAALKQGKLGDIQDWREFSLPVTPVDDKIDPATRDAIRTGSDRHAKMGLGFSFHLAWMEDPIDSELTAIIARRTLAQEVTKWLECWKLGRTDRLSDLVLQWNEVTDKWELGITYHGFLFPAIALQLALVVADIDSLFTCSGCGIPYVRPRESKRPKSGWANYCGQCKNNGVAQRRATENYREKKSKAASLHRGGLKIQEIAEQLNTKVARVSAWLEKEGIDAKTKTGK